MNTLIYPILIIVFFFSRGARIGDELELKKSNFIIKPHKQANKKLYYLLINKDNTNSSIVGIKKKLFNDKAYFRLSRKSDEYFDNTLRENFRFKGYSESSANDSDIEIYIRRNIFLSEDNHRGIADGFFPEYVALTDISILVKYRGKLYYNRFKTHTEYNKYCLVVETCLEESLKISLNETIEKLNKGLEELENYE